MFSKILKQLFKNKFVAAATFLAVAIGGYFAYRAVSVANEPLRYSLAEVEKGSLIVSVSGSGQAAVLDQIDVKPKVSGELIYLSAENGQETKAGTLLAQLDTRDSQKAVREAEITLTNAELELKKIQGKAEESLAAAYDDGLNALTNTFKELLPLMPDLKKMFTQSSYSGGDNDIGYYLHLVRTYNSDSEQLSYWDADTKQKYLALEKKFDAVKTVYFALNQNSSYEQIETAINQTYETVRLFLDLARQGYNLTQKYQTIIEAENITPPISADTTAEQISQLAELTSLLISRASNLSSIKQSLIDKKEALAKESLDIETQNLNVKQRQYALADAKENLAQHYIVAPFDGLITKVNVKKGDAVSAGTALINLVTRQKMAEIALNEVDAAKVKVGQKATLTFDALPETNVAGRVFEVDALGTITQGVVSYGVKISFDADIEEIKPGMSVTADIITDIKQDILVVPNSAIKSQGNSFYVELVEISEEIRQRLLSNISGTVLPVPPKLQAVETGISNDLSTEIISGLKEGDIVVVSTISPNNSQTAQTRTSQTQGFQIPGMGGQMRISR